MKKQALRVIALLSLILTLAMAPAHAQDRAGAKRKVGKCVPVGGTISTNFISEDTTLGTVTGDLRGAVSAMLLSSSPPDENGKLIAQIQHRAWVTEAGDILRLAQATLELIPTEDEGIYYAAYKPPITIAGGTGRFEHATGTLYVNGSIDFNRGELVLRYRGEICAGK